MLSRITKISKHLLSTSTLCLAISLISFSSCSKEEPKVEHPISTANIMEVNFDESMGQSQRELKKALALEDDAQRYALLKKLYTQNSMSSVTYQDQPKIPKIIHQIWLGPKLPPPYFREFQEKWRRMHPDWEYRLWTDADLDLLNPDLKDLIEQSSNWAEKSDVLRCEILERFGGVYIDVDMDCLHPLTELHHKYDFYAACEFPHMITTKPNRIWVGISIIASKPHHPIIKAWKQKIREGWDLANSQYTYFGHRVVNHTYFPFSYAIFENHSKDDCVDIVLPATYFYPLSGKIAQGRHGFKQKVKGFLYDTLELLHLKSPPPYSKIQPETIAVHYWGNTWIQKTHDQVKDLRFQLENMKSELFKLQKRIHDLESHQDCAVSSEQAALSFQ